MISNGITGTGSAWPHGPPQAARRSAAWRFTNGRRSRRRTTGRRPRAAASPPTKIGFGTLVYLAQQHSPGWTYGSADEEPDETETSTVILDGIKLDENIDWTQPEGLIGTITDWIMLTSRRPHRPMAFASAISVLSAICGRHLYGPTGTALNVYIVCLAGTAVGKDRPLSAPGAILAAANLHRLHTTAKGFSVSALEQMMIDHPCCLATVDEIGASLFARMSHKHASTHEQGMRSVLLELWSRDQFKGPFSTTRHAVQKGGPKVPGSVSIPRPNLTLFGVSTPEAFYAAVTAGSVKDGFLNRFLTCEAAQRGKPQEVSEEDGEVPEEIVTALKKLVPHLTSFGCIAAPLASTPSKPTSTRSFAGCPGVARTRANAPKNWRNRSWLRWTAIPRQRRYWAACSNIRSALPACTLSAGKV